MGYSTCSTAWCFFFCACAQCFTWHEAESQEWEEYGRWSWYKTYSEQWEWKSLQITSAQRGDCGDVSRLAQSTTATSAKALHPAIQVTQVYYLSAGDNQQDIISGCMCVIKIMRKWLSCNREIFRILTMSEGSYLLILGQEPCKLFTYFCLQYFCTFATLICCGTYAELVLQSSKV